MVRCGRRTADLSPSRSTQAAKRFHFLRCQSRPCTVTTLAIEIAGPLQNEITFHRRRNYTASLGEFDQSRFGLLQIAF